MARELTEGVEFSVFPSNASALRLALGALSISEGKLKLRNSRVRASGLSRVVSDMNRVEATEVQFLRGFLRVVPYVFYDSPDHHAERRANITRSSVVRRILGNAAASLTPVKDSIIQRQAMVDTLMVSENEG